MRVEAASEKEFLILEEFGAGGRTRTDMSLRTPDFESGAYTNFATPAATIKGKR
jgi:hypothetical protein